MNGIAIDHSQLKQYLVVLGDVRARRKDFKFFEKSGKPHFLVAIIGAPHYTKNPKFHSATREGPKLYPHHPGPRRRTLGLGNIGRLRARVYALGNTPVPKCENSYCKVL
jgi:hypothetical protein